MTVLTRKPTAIYESPIFAQDLNSLQIQWVSARKMTEDPLPKRKWGKSISSPHKDKPVLYDEKGTNFKTEITNFIQKTDTLWWVDPG